MRNEEANLNIDNESKLNEEKKRLEDLLKNVDDEEERRRLLAKLRKVDQDIANQLAEESNKQDSVLQERMKRRKLALEKKKL